jgi:hydroxypyruvate isomerase
VLNDIRESVLVARRCNVRWLVMASCDRSSGESDSRAVRNGVEWLGFGQQGVELLKRCSAMLEPHGMVLLVDPPYELHAAAGGLAGALQQAVDVCRAVGSPACKVRLDLYQQSMREDEWTFLLDRCRAEVAYLQCGDRPGRREPGTGAINYRRIFRDLHANGFDGILAMEHGNAFPGADGELAVVNAYRAVDNF